VLKRAMGWFTVVAVCAVFGGCKSGDDDAAPLSQDELPGAMASLVCDSLGDCCSSAKLVFDSTNCRAATSAQVKASLNETLTAAVKYDAEAAGDCVAELKKRAKCGRTGSLDDVPACDRVLVGTLAAGQPCQSNEECAAPGYCNTDLVTFEDICTVSSSSELALVRGKAGDTCYATCEDPASCAVLGPSGNVVGDPIEPGTTPVVCYRSDSLYCSGNCQPLKAIGETCDAASACKDGLFCDFDFGICTAPHPNGAACSDDVECQSGNCGTDSTGDTLDGTCLASSVTAQECANGML
jgi:hypothetical protein